MVDLKNLVTLIVGVVNGTMELIILAYICVRYERDEGVGGGCATFREDISLREISKGKVLEYIIIEIWTNEGELVIINFYNPCKKLEVDS